MQDNRSKPGVWWHLMLHCMAIAAAILLVPTGCAVRTTEDLETISIEADQERHFRSLVLQVYRSVSAMQSIFGPLGMAERSGLSIDSATLSMDIRHAQDENGNLAALLTAGVADSQSVDDKVVIMIDPGSIVRPDSVAQSLSEPYRDYQPCHLPPAGSEDGSSGDRLDVLLVRASMTALDAWLCVADEFGHAPVALEALTITLTINATQDDSGGLALTLGAFSVGEELDLTTDHVATVEFELSRPSGP